MRRFAVPASALVLLGAALLTPSLTTASAAEPEVTVTSLHFKVEVGPDLDQECDVVGDLYVPDEASSSNRLPAILTTHGFGGTKEDQAGISRAMAEHGYVVLAYSGLGFGGSGCQITLDDPDWDGQAGRQLISYLGGAPGIAYEDAAHTDPDPGRAQDGQGQPAGDRAPLRARPPDPADRRRWLGELPRWRRGGPGADRVGLRAGAEPAGGQLSGRAYSGPMAPASDSPLLALSSTKMTWVSLSPMFSP